MSMRIGLRHLSTAALLIGALAATPAAGATMDQAQFLGGAAPPSPGMALQVTPGGATRVLWPRGLPRSAAGWLRSVTTVGSTVFTSPLRLSALGMTPETAAFDGHGGAWVVGFALVPQHTGVRVIRVLHLSATGRISPPETVSAAGEDAGPATLAVNARGDALVGWASGVSGRPTSVMTALHRAGGHWVRHPVPHGSGLPVGSLSDQLSVALNARGDGGIMFQQSSAMRVALLGSHGRWAAPATIGTLTRPGFTAPRLAINARGDVLATWADSLVSGENDVNPGPTTVSAALRSSGQPFRPAVVLDTTPVGDVDTGPRSALADDGRLLIAWYSAGGLEIAQGTVSGGIAPAQTLDGDRIGLGGQFDAALAPSGTSAVVAWVHDGTGVEAAVAGADGRFATPVTISPTSQVTVTSLSAAATGSHVAVGYMGYPSGTTTPSAAWGWTADAP
jgi:hypothetical protein